MRIALPLRRRWWRSAWIGLVVLSVSVPTNPAVCGEEASERAAADAAQRLDELKEAAASYVIERESEPPVRLVVVPEPVLRWNNPIRTAYDGAVFVWVGDGRPEVVACFYRSVDRGVPMEHHEFLSLSQTSLRATSRGRQVWAPRLPGIDRKPIPGASTPTADAAGRMRQMRALAREFQAGYVHEERASGLSLRMLTKPLQRYKNSGPESVDGALFAFVEATDPEVILLIEARPEGGSPKWQYSLARMSTRGLRAWHQDRLVWEVPKIQPQVDSSPYGKVAEPVRPH